MAPEVGSVNPAIIRSSVVLPQPDGPRMEKKLPSATSNDTLFTAIKLSNVLLTFFTDNASRMKNLLNESFYSGKNKIMG
jgi:hypothetical protein